MGFVRQSGLLTRAGFCSRSMPNILELSGQSCPAVLQVQKCPSWPDLEDQISGKKAHGTSISATFVSGCASDRSFYKLIKSPYTIVSAMGSDPRVAFQKIVPGLCNESTRLDGTFRAELGSNSFNRSRSRCRPLLRLLISPRISIASRPLFSHSACIVLC